MEAPGPGLPQRPFYIWPSGGFRWPHIAVTRRCQGGKTANLYGRPDRRDERPRRESGINSRHVAFAVDALGLWAGHPQSPTWAHRELDWLSVHGKGERSGGPDQAVVLGRAPS